MKFKKGKQKKLAKGKQNCFLKCQQKVSKIFLISKKKVSEKVNGKRSKNKILKKVSKRSK